MVAVAGGPTQLADLQAVTAGSTQRPVCLLRKTLPVGVASGGAVLSWDIEDLDTHGWHSTSVNTSRVTPTKAGWVRVTGTVHWANTSATGRRGVAVRVNGGNTTYGTLIPGTTVGNTGTTVTKTVAVNGTTDYIEVFAFQDSGGSVNAVDGLSTCFEVEWLRDL